MVLKEPMQSLLGSGWSCPSVWSSFLISIIISFRVLRVGYVDFCYNLSLSFKAESCMTGLNIFSMHSPSQESKLGNLHL